MSAQIKKKNLKATQGKKRWRKNIDITDLQNEINQNQEFVLEPTKKNQQSLLTFTIDNKQTNIYENKDRFKKKPIDPKLLSKSELKQIKAFSKNINTINNQPQVKDQNNNLQNDPWSDEEDKKIQIGVLERPKFIVQPVGGQSYNPSYEDHQKLLSQVLEDELKQGLNKVKVNDQNVSGKIKRREQRKNDRERLRRIARQQGTETVQRILEKRKDHSFTLIKRTKQELNKKELSRQTKLKQKLEEKKQEEEAYKKGKLIKPKKIGRKILKPTIDTFVLDEQLPERLRLIQANETLVHNQFESYYRRGLVEPKGVSNKLRKAKIGKYKFKEVIDPRDRQKVEEDIVE